MFVIDIVQEVRHWARTTGGLANACSKPYPASNNFSQLLKTTPTTPAKPLTRRCVCVFFVCDSQTLAPQQQVITFLQFMVVAGFLAALLWLFRPAEDSPYLLMGDGLDTLDTALGVDDEDEDGMRTPQRIHVGDSSSGGGGGRAVEMMAAGGSGGTHMGGFNSKGPAGGLLNGSSSSSDRGANRDQQQQGVGGVGVGVGGSSSRPGSSAGGAVVPPLSPPVNLPAIKTSAGGGSTSTPAPVAAPPQPPAAAPAANFSLGGDDDELHEIQLDSAKASAVPPKTADKRD